MIDSNKHIIKTVGIHRPPEQVNVAGHALVNPSAASIWGAPDGCPGYVMMRAQFPEHGDRDAADEGTLAHAQASNMITDVAFGRLRDPQERADRIGKNGITVEVFDGAAMYATDVRDVMYSAHVFGGPNLGIEQPVLCEWIHPHCFGTPDAWLFDFHSGRLYIWDFKFGRGLVDVFENWQLITYAAGILQLLGIGPTDNQVDVEFRIVQPRGFHADGPIRTWTCKPERLQSMWCDLTTNAALALSGTAKVRPGPHCRYCEARHACSSAQRLAMDSIDYIGDPVGHEMKPDAVARELLTLRRAQKAIEYRLTGIEEQAKSLIRSGKPMPGLRVQDSVGNLEWTATPETIAAVGKITGIDLVKPQTMTPTQAIAAGVDEKLIKSLSKRQKRGVKVVEDDCKAARKAFGR